MIYETFAQVYDALMDKTLYDQWFAYAKVNFLPETKQVLDLACGSGDLAVKFAQAGFEVTGIDISEEMLTLAETKMIQTGTQVLWLQEDMLDLSMPENFDAVTCFDDSLCYLADFTALKNAFRNIWDALRSGGIFLFDLHSLYQMDQIFPGYMYNAKLEDLAFMWTSYASETVKHGVKHDLTFFVWDDTIQGYQAFEELHHERTYPLTDIKTALRDIGFEKIELTADFGRQEIIGTTPRWFIKCQKCD